MRRHSSFPGLTFLSTQFLNQGGVLMRTVLLLVLAAAIGIVLAGCSEEDTEKEPRKKEIAEVAMAKDIVDIAADDGRFTTLVTAVKAAGLVETLKSDGPFTVFAPTDDAFAALPAGTVEALLNDIPKLKSILLYHVVQGKVMAADVVKLKSADTALGKSLSIAVSGDKVMVNEATVVITDIEASNGVIHVIDSVILPSEK